jgi:hypothetical protein
MWRLQWPHLDVRERKGGLAGEADRAISLSAAHKSRDEHLPPRHVVLDVRDAGRFDRPDLLELDLGAREVLE